MKPAALSIGALEKADRRRSQRGSVNWRLVLALGVNVGLWGGIYVGVKTLLS